MCGVIRSMHARVVGIQPHGALLIVDEHDLAVTASSANAAAILGRDIAIGAGIGQLFDPPTELALRRALTTGELDEAIAVTAGTRAFDMIVHRTRSVIVELEPMRPGPRVAPAILRCGDRVFGARSLLEAAAIVAAEIHALCGFDRVAIYRFHPTGTMRIAEIGDAPAEPEAHHALAPGEGTRFIADRAAAPVAADAELGGAVLRAYALAGAGAALTIPLGEHGVIACDDPRPMHLAHAARCACTAVARLLAWQIAAEREPTGSAADDFIATVSHELRTPLNALLGWLRLVEGGHVSPERRAHGLATATRNAGMLATLVDELLDVSRVVTGKMRLDMQLVSPAPIVEAALATIHPAAAAKSIAVEAALDREVGPILADASRLQQVICNLLVNAIKFTPERGTVRVALRGGTHVEIEVSDTGVGIDPALLPRVFDRYRQGQSHGGLGLGLAIVRELVDLHGGEVSADSAGADRGSRFVVRLPRATGRGVAARVAAPVFEPSPQLRGLRVLVVDDDLDARELIRAVLATSEVEVALASTAAEALALVHQHRPDVVLADIGMPGTDGYELIARIRALPEPLGRVPAIAITAYARSQDRSRAFLAGYDIHVAKPVDPAELVAMLVGLGGRRTAPRPIVDPTAGPLDGARLLVVEDDADSRGLLAVVLANAGAIVEEAGTAAEGLAAVARFRPDVLLSDLGLPDKDGLTFIRELRAAGSDNGGWIPAIAISGRASPEEARNAILAGFQLHITKPFQPADLIARLARLVARTMRRTP